VSSAITVSCAHCGAPGVAVPGAAVSLCRFCGRETHVQQGGAADQGAPIAIADFRGPNVVGFVYDKRDPPPDGERLACEGGTPPQLRVTMPEQKGTIFLWLGGSFDDVDMRATYKFAPGVSADAALAFRFRVGADGEGGYEARVWSDGVWKLSARDAGAWDTVSSGRVSQGFHPPGGWNTLRAVAKGERLRVYLGGMLLVSVGDGRSKQGRFSLRAHAGGKPLELWLASLEVREAV
jgi:3-keto-disaccharide hydrolase